MRNFVHQFFRYCIPTIAFLAFLFIVNAAIPYLLCASLGLFLIGAASFAFSRYLTPRILPPDMSELLVHVTQLEAPEKKLLTPEELAHFKKIAQPNELKRLEAYEKYIGETCGITLTSIPELAFPITVEHINENPFFAKTYEKEALEDWIGHVEIENQRNEQKICITEPQKRWYRLDDPHIKIYAGFPNWVVQFVKEALAFIKNRPLSKRERIAEEREQFYQKNFKPLFSHPINNTTEDKTSFINEKKMNVA